MKISRWIVGSLLFFSITSYATSMPPRAAIATAHPLATQAGMAILDAGGNAFDAAVTVAAVLAVVEPYHSGLGGGGFWLLHDARAPFTRDVFIDARERAPSAATKDMFAKHSQTPEIALQGALAGGIPGEVAGITYLAKNYGKLPLSQTLAPAIKLAKEGFPIDANLLKKLQLHQALVSQFSSTRKIFFPVEKTLTQGMLLKQPELADVLMIIAQRGHSGFYEAEVAQRLVQGVRNAGGIWQLEDLRDYQIVIRQPLKGKYHDLLITTAPLPSSGGIALLEALNILDQYELHPLSDADRKHLIVESLRRVYCDRAHYLGDPDFVQVDVKQLLSPGHAKQWQKTIDLSRATKSSTLNCGISAKNEAHTTHYAILDQQGNAVSATLSINSIFGSGWVIPHTGILLNNQMDDFTLAEGVPSSAGLIGSHVNTIAPKKKPLSSMTPSFIETPRGFGILGTTGGSRIPSMMLLAVLSAEKDEYPYTWELVPRFHHQYLPDEIQYEPGAFTPELQHALIARGHTLKQLPEPYGDMQAIFWDQSRSQVFAASDQRQQGLAMVK